jgi:hypothetical protein
VDLSLRRRGILPVRLAVGLDHRVVPQTYASSRRSEPATAIAETVEVSRDPHIRVDQQTLVAPNCRSARWMQIEQRDDGRRHGVLEDDVVTYADQHISDVCRAHRVAEKRTPVASHRDPETASPFISGAAVDGSSNHIRP